ncbi:tyrosine-protein phosphatase [Prauserella halophila]|uniref:Tyrosine-protein phosphatase n=1 Tax=Prauserella halophila TaxID=185641 RepID=A0ABN1WMA8_9PSEU
MGWEGSYNARDLGGLPTADGGMITWGAVVRSEEPRWLTGAGWRSVWEHGVRTIVDLRNDDERADAVVAEGIDVVHAPLDPVGDDFWTYYAETGLHATPLCYRDLLDKRPDLVATAVRAVATARSGGVLVHCAGGRDRTGLLVLILLGLVGVPGDVIADDYELSRQRLPGMWARLGMPDDEPKILDLLASHGTTPREAFLDVHAGLDAEGLLRAEGLEDADLAALRHRLVA